MENEDKIMEQQDQTENELDPELAQVCGPNTTPYVVRPGDTFFTIARQFGVTVDALIQANPQIPNPSQIRPGQIVCIPQQTTVCPSGTFSYIVQRGDTMFTIAQRFGVSLQALLAANPQIPDPSRLTPGQTVCVPEISCPINTFSYTVRQGDTMFSIAQQFGVPLNSLLAANPQVTNPNQLYPGQNVCVPRTTPPPTCPTGTFRYIVQSGDTMFTIAQRFGVSLQALLAANPQIPDPSRLTPGQTVCVPEISCPINTFSYTVQQGDTMFSIAQHFGVSLNALLAANPQVTNPNQLYPGQNVCVPRTTPPPTCPPGTFSYTVQAGDSMWSIAQRFGVSLDALIAANPQIPNPSQIVPGQIVCVPQGSPPPTGCPAGTFAYTVQRGDSMWSIAQRFGVSLDALIRANPQIPNPSQIVPGQIVCVPQGSKPPSGCPAGTFAYTVKAGDSMWSIARKFGVSLDALIRANPQIPNPSQIKPGQIVCVPNR